MNKIFKGTIIGMTVLLSLSTVSNAATKEELLNYVTKKHTVAGEELKVSNSDYVKIERYFSEYPIDEETADKVIAKLEEAVALMNQEGVSDPFKLKIAKKKELLGIAQDIAKLTGATLTYSSKDKTITVYREGKVYDVIYFGSDATTFRATGNNNFIVINTMIAIAAIATGLGYKKLRRNAE